MSRPSLKALAVNFVINHKYPSLLIVLIVIWILAALMLCGLESYATSGTAYRSFGHSLWAIIVYLTSGLDEAPPETVGGRVVSILVLLAGVFVVGGITACLTSDLVEGVMRGSLVPEKPRRLSLDGHTVIFGAPRSADRIVRELHHPLIGSSVPVVIVCRDRRGIPLGDPERYKNVYSVQGEFTDEEVLRRANIETARTAIILTQEVGDDEQAVLTCLAVKVTQPRVHAIVELKDPANERHLSRARADEIIHLDSTALIAQCALTHDVSTVFEELLTVQSDGNEIYVVPVPTRLVGRTFREAALDLLDHRVVLVGVMSPFTDLGGSPADGGAAPAMPAIHVNPVPDHRLIAGDGLVAIGFSRPDLA